MKIENKVLRFMFKGLLVLHFITFILRGIEFGLRLLVNKLKKEKETQILGEQIVESATRNKGKS